MADMLDPSIAEALARATRQIATNTAQIKGNIASASNHMAILNGRMQKLVGHTTGAAGAARDLAKNLGASGVNASEVANQTTKAASGARSLGDETQKNSRLMNYLLNVVKGVGAFIAGDILISMEKLRTQGIGPAQVEMLTFQSMWTQLSMLIGGVPARLGNIVSATMNLSNSLGGTHMISQQMIKDVTTLNSLYGVSIETGAKFEAMIYRWSNGSATVAKHSLDFAASLSKASGVPLNVLMKEVADNADAVARYGAKGVGVFMQQAVQLARMGTSVKEMSAFSDKLVDDFEGSLVATAKIQTMLPGFNMAKVQYAAQFGTEADVGKALSDALKESGLKEIGQLPRSLRNLLGQSLGINQSTIENMLHTIAPTKPEKPFTVDVFDSTMNKVLSNLNDLVKIGLGLLAAALGGSVLSNKLTGKGPVGALFAKMLGRNAGAGLIPKGSISGLFRGLFGKGAAGAATGAAAETVGGLGTATGTALTGAGAAVGAGEGALLTGAAQFGGATAAALPAAAAGAGAAGGGGLLAGLGAIALPVTIVIGALYALSMGIYKFYNGMKDGLGFLKSFGNALAGIVSLGLWTPFKKAAMSSEQLAKSQADAAKSTSQFSEALDQVGIQNREFADAMFKAHGAPTLTQQKIIPSSAQVFRGQLQSTTSSADVFRGLSVPAAGKSSADVFGGSPGAHSSAEVFGGAPTAPVISAPPVPEVGAAIGETGHGIAAIAPAKTDNTDVVAGLDKLHSKFSDLASAISSQTLVASINLPGVGKIGESIIQLHSKGSLTPSISHG